MLLAQSSFVDEIIRALAMNGFWLFLSVCIIAGTAKHLFDRYMQHRERLFMIENGLHPDSKPSDADSTISFDQEHRA